MYWQKSAARPDTVYAARTESDFLMKPALTALGIINALGNNPAEVLSNLLAGVSPGMTDSADWLPDRSVCIGTVTAALPEIPVSLQMFDCRNNRLLLAALTQIQNAIAEALNKYGVERIGVVIGSSTSGIAEGEIALAEKQHTQQWPSHYHYQQQEIGSPAHFVAHYLGLKGITYTVSTACSSSAKVLGSARRLLELDLCDAVICGGSDSLCRLTLNGFAALDALSAERCEPFATGRNGINIGEGAALFLMEKPADPSAFIQLAGVGESADAHHISAPHPDGVGAEVAMRAALNDADIDANAIDYINLHGTATPLNDSMESAAVARVFSHHIPCSSTKPLTGHTLGAAGATEAALCWLLLSRMNKQRTLPAQKNTAAPDETLAPIHLLRTPEKLSTKNAMSNKKTLRMLSNSFAFGGSNATVILESHT